MWTVLYVLIGVAGWRLWLAGAAARGALVLWAVQLVLNALWSWIFFGLHAPGLALVEILLLLSAIAWVAFATALNAALWILN